MKLEPAQDKFESLYQGFILLFSSPTPRHQEEVGQMLCLMLMDPDITQKHAQDACCRAIAALQLENNLMKQFGGKNG